MTFDTRARQAAQGVHRAVEVMELSSTKTPQRVTRFDQYRERKSRNQRIRAGALAIVLVLVGVIVLVRAVGRAVPAEPSPSPSPTRPFAGMVITHTNDPYQSGDLVAADPATGEVRTVFQSQLPPGEEVVYNAAISGDGRWVAFDVSTGCGDAGPQLWVTNGVDEPRRLTEACGESSEHDSLGLWEWSPSGAQIVVALGSSDGDALVLIDPATGGRTDLGETGGVLTSLSWSRDETRIAYGTVPVGTGDGISDRVRASVSSVDVRSADHALLTNVIGQVPGGEEGSGIQWSPDGRRIAVLAGITDARLYLMKADGSNVELLTEDVHIEHSLATPNLDWSPDGTRIAYATFTGDRDKMQIWNGSPDGSSPVRVFGSASALGRHGLGLSGAPVWSPDGTQIAFRYSQGTDNETVWLVANADGTGGVHTIDELQFLSWRGGWYFCECYG
jgi:Tol biopolymer transport system component